MIGISGDHITDILAILSTGINCDFFSLAEPNQQHIQTRRYAFISPRFQRFEKAQVVAV